MLRSALDEASLASLQTRFAKWTAEGYPDADEAIKRVIGRLQIYDTDFNGTTIIPIFSCSGHAPDRIKGYFLFGVNNNGVEAMVMLMDSLRRMLESDVTSGISVEVTLEETRALRTEHVLPEYPRETYPVLRLSWELIECEERHITVFLDTLVQAMFSTLRRILALRNPQRSRMHRQGSTATPTAVVQLPMPIVTVLLPEVFTVLDRLKGKRHARRS